MNIRPRNLILVSFFAVIAVTGLFAATVSANHRTAMEVCASHGLGPNLRFAEGADSALIHCLEAVNTSDVVSLSISYREAASIVGELDPAPLSYREIMSIVGELDHAPISYREVRSIVG